jgi:hypothetical protein
MLAALLFEADLVDEALEPTELVAVMELDTEYVGVMEAAIVGVMDGLLEAVIVVDPDSEPIRDTVAVSVPDDVVLCVPEAEKVLVTDGVVVLDIETEADCVSVELETVMVLVANGKLGVVDGVMD